MEGTHFETKNLLNDLEIAVDETLHEYYILTDITREINNIETRQVELFERLKILNEEVYPVLQPRTDLEPDKEKINEIDNIKRELHNLRLHKEELVKQRNIQNTKYTKIRNTVIQIFKRIKLRIDNLPKNDKLSVKFFYLAAKLNLNSDLMETHKTRLNQIENEENERRSHRSHMRAYDALSNTNRHSLATPEIRASIAQYLHKPSEKAQKLYPIVDTLNRHFSRRNSKSSKKGGKGRKGSTRRKNIKK